MWYEQLRPDAVLQDLALRSQSYTHIGTHPPAWIMVFLCNLDTAEVTLGLFHGGRDGICQIADGVAHSQIADLFDQRIRGIGRVIPSTRR